jgi:hypothetical protein
MPAIDLVTAFLALLPQSTPDPERMAPPAPLPVEQRRMVPPVPPGEVKTQEIVQLVRTRGLNGKKLVKPLTKIYGDRPGFKIEFLKEVECFIIRGDEKTVEQICQILQLLTPAGLDK